METVAGAKRIWRRELRARIAALHPETVARKSARLVALLRQRLDQENPGLVALFAALPGEPDLTGLHAGSGQWAYPKVSQDGLTFWRVKRVEDLVPGHFGIREPAEDHAMQVEPGELSWILVPGLGFGRDGSRLGRGKRYYDRFLASARGLTVGVAFTEQVEPAMPRDEWDRPMAELVTEDGWWQCGGGEG